MLPPDLQAEVTRLRAELAEAKGEAPEERPRVRHGVSEPRRGVETKPRTAQELWDWMSSKQHDLQELLEFGGSRNAVFGLASLLAEAAERMHSHQDKRSRLILHQCGLVGCRVGEASNPGPGLFGGIPVPSSDDEPVSALVLPIAHLSGQ